MKELTQKQQRFVTEYLKDFNGTNAAIRAGYSEKTAYAAANKLLKLTNVKAKVEEANTKLATSVHLTKEDILQDLIDIKDNNHNSNPRVALQAIDQISKILGFNAPTRQDISITQEQPLFTDLRNLND